MLLLGLTLIDRRETLVPLKPKSTEGAKQGEFKRGIIKKGVTKVRSADERHITEDKVAWK